jgi:hypothetical protein
VNGFIVAGALLLIGSVAGALARVYLPRAKGSHHGPRSHPFRSS